MANIKVAKENLMAMKDYIDKNKDYQKALVCARNAFSVLEGTQFKEKSSAIVRAMISKRYMDAIRGANSLIPYLK